MVQWINRGVALFAALCSMHTNSRALTEHPGRFRPLPLDADGWVCIVLSREEDEMPDLAERAAAFVADLTARREDRGLMADLRRGFSSATADRAWPYLARWCDLTHDRQRVIYQTVAAGFATNPETTTEGNMGDTMRALATGKVPGEDGLKTFEARFRRFLSCDTISDVSQRLPTVIRATQARGIPINHRRLLEDLHYWGDRVKIRWAGAYWGSARGESNT